MYYYYYCLFIFVLLLSPTVKFCELASVWRDNPSPKSICWLNMIIDQASFRISTNRNHSAKKLGIGRDSAHLVPVQGAQRTCWKSVNGSSVLKSIITINYRWTSLRWFWRASAYRQSVAPAVVTVADIRMDTLWKDTRGYVRSVIDRASGTTLETHHHPWNKLWYQQSWTGSFARTPGWYF